MPNRNNPHGLRPLFRTLSGGFPFVQEFRKKAAYATALFIWDAVNRVADGTVEASATPGTTLYSGVNLNYGPASTDTYHQVIVSPDAVYEAQDSRSSGSFTADDAGANCNLTLGAGNPNTLISGHQVDGSTLGTSSSLDVKLHSLFDVPDNEPGTGYTRVVVSFNKHRLFGGVAGV